MLPDISSQLRKGVIESCILGLLSREPMYGWQLADTLTRTELIASIGTLYPVLTRLRKRGLITAIERESTTGPVRKYYELTLSGERELAAFRTHWGHFTRTVTGMLGADDDAITS